MRLRFLANVLSLLALPLLVASEAGAGTYAVTNLDDSGPGSLRQAIIDSNNEAGPAGIVIDTEFLTGTIKLQSELPAMTDTVTFFVLGSRPIIVDANQTGRVFTFYGPGDIQYEIRGHLEITGGYTLQDGGGIFVGGGANLLVEGVSIYGNDAENGDGGGILRYLGGTLEVHKSRIWNNHARRGAGLATGDFTVVSQSSIYDNVASSDFAGSGGGIYNFGHLQVLESTIANNRALGGDPSISSGGGIVLHNDSTLQMFQSAVIGNAAELGPGLDLRPGVTLSDSTANIIAGNVDLDTGLVSNCSKSLGLVDRYNLSSDDSCGFTGASDLENTDPMLWPLLWAGGPTPTMVPREGSPVIDAGSNPFCLDVDQRDFSRPVDGDGVGDAICDIGPVEFTPGFDDMFEIHADGFESGDTSGWSLTVN